MPREDCDGILIKIDWVSKTTILESKKETNQMNLDQFNEQYRYDESGKYLNQRSKIEISCDRCGTAKNITRCKAESNIKKNGEYVCRSCITKVHHKENPRGEITKEKQRQGRLGKSHTEKAKEQMSTSAKTKWQSDWGMKQRKNLSKLSAMQNSNSNLDKSKRKILYISAKNNNEIRTCLSSGEFIACEDILEKDSNVLSYETQVYYEIDNRYRSIDFLIKYKNGVIKAIEVKPAKRLLEEKNVLQIKDVETYAKLMGWEFEIWTEIELGIDCWKTVTKRADEYKKLHYGVDHSSYRKKQSVKRAQKHYIKKSNNKVDVWCDFCNETHNLMKSTYESNLKRNNGTYICGKYGGHLAGKTPKKKKENPYAKEGKKQCIGCDKVKLLEEFGIDKGRSDGLASKCKLCRSKAATEKYHKNK